VYRIVVAHLQQEVAEGEVHGEEYRRKEVVCRLGQQVRVI
jgi:hypothetical protein